MKRYTILAALILTISFYKSQTSAVSVTGNYIGEFVVNHVVSTIDVKQNHKYVLKTYYGRKKLLKKVKGEWLLDGDKLVLTEKSGTVTVLKKFNDVWYITDKNGTYCLARFYQGIDANKYWGDYDGSGC